MIFVFISKNVIDYLRLKLLKPIKVKINQVYRVANFRQKVPPTDEDTATKT